MIRSLQEAKIVVIIVIMTCIMNTWHFFLFHFNINIDSDVINYLQHNYCNNAFSTWTTSMIA